SACCGRDSRCWAATSPGTWRRPGLGSAFSVWVRRCSAPSRPGSAPTPNTSACGTRRACEAGRPCWSTGRLGRSARPRYSGPHIRLVRKLGAESVIDYTRTDFTRAGRRYDVIFDVAGTSSFGRCRRTLNPGGVYLTTAPSPAIIAAMPWTARFGSRRAVVAFTGLRPASEKRKDLLVIRELAEASALVPVVGACYPLARIADAYRHVDAGHKKGTIVVAMS